MYPAALVQGTVDLLQDGKQLPSSRVSWQETQLLIGDVACLQGVSQQLLMYEVLKNFRDTW